MKEENLQKAVCLRHHLHMYPELSMNESGTCARIQEFLKKNTGLQVIDRGGWCFAVKKGKTGGKRIAFRADMDALPIPEAEDLPYHSRNRGISHKCGHDGHCAVLCGLALELDAMETEKTVYLIFQPGEETGQGARICRGLLREEGISGIYAFHNLGGFPENSLIFREGLTQPASEGLRIRFLGKTSHASAPEEGNNPALPLSKTVLFANDLAGAGSADAENGAVLCTVTGIRLGTGDFGISPGEGELCVTLRAEKESEMKRMERELLTFAKQAGYSAGIRTVSSIHDYFPETRNDSTALSRILHAAKEVGIETIRMDHIWRASEDFGWYLKECPGAMVYIGNGEKYPPLHTPDYDFNDRILGTAADLFLRLVSLSS
ncbi:MAG: M20 family metallopeptidase [Eubacteriales bacterium]|nr:M20 family metallopeptidase [Eubacteriales bacterium]